MEPSNHRGVMSIIDTDNKSFCFADEDGFMEGKIINKDRVT
jgi:hypothetical protein